MRKLIVITATILTIVVSAAGWTPAGAHVGGTVTHLWRDHIVPKLAAMPDCPGGQSIRAFDSQGRPACDSDSAFAAWDDQVTLTTNANELKRVAYLDVPAGRYVINAKLHTTIPPNDPYQATMRCDLVAGANFDRTIATFDAATPEQTLSLMVVNRFEKAGQVALNCGYLYSNNSSTLRFIKIIATNVGMLRNTAL